MHQEQPDSNPYPGPRTFHEDEADRFFGRDREARELLALVLGERLTLFYAQSGAGKSSLINARLLPGLRAEGFEVLSLTRVSGARPDGLEPQNIFVYNLVSALNQSLPEAERKTSAELANVTLARFLAGEPAGAEGEPAPAAEGMTSAASEAQPSPGEEGEYVLIPHALIVDQFEEIITTHLDRWPQRGGFFEQLAEAMERYPNLWVVLTVREDYVSALEPYAHLVPNRLRARFYMQRMGEQSALEAIKQPANKWGRPFAFGVGQMLVDNLRAVRGQRLGAAGEHLGEYVEPVQLQVVCHELWEVLQRERPGREITADDLQFLAHGRALADFVDGALLDFYESAVAEVLKEPGIGVTEPQLRRWFSQELLTEVGARNLLFYDVEKGETAGLPKRAVDLLIKRFLLRTELRSGGTYVELVHDRFVEPIRESNDAWFKKNQSALERQAAIWRDEGKPPDRLLLAGDDLAEAERWAAEHERELEPHEKELVAASKAARDAAERELETEREAARQRELEAAQALAVEQRERADEQALAAGQLRRRALIAAILATVAVILGITAAIFGLQSLQNASLAATRAVAAEISAAKAATAEAEARVNADAAQAAEAEARANADAATRARAEAERALARAVSQRIAALAKSSGESGSLDVAALLMAEALRAADTPAARLAIEDLLPSWPEVQTHLHALDAPVGSLAFSQDGGVLVSGDDAGRLVVWRELASSRPISETLETGLGTIQAVAIRPRAGVLAAGTSDGRIRMWEGEQRPARRLDGHTEGITGLAFSPDDRFLASASFDGRTFLWPLASQRGNPIPLEGPDGPVTAISFSPDGTRLAAGGVGGQVTIWGNLEAPQLFMGPQIGKAISATVASLAFDPAGARLAIGFDDGQFTIYDLARGELVFAPVDAGDPSVESLAFDLQDDALVVLFADGSLKRYLLDDLATGVTVPASWTQPVLRARGEALTADGRSWAIGLDTGTIMLGRTGGPPRLDASADSEALIEQFCRIANRNLSEIEWHALIGEDVPYHKTCPAIE